MLDVLCNLQMNVYVDFNEISNAVGAWGNVKMQNNVVMIELDPILMIKEE
jgi:hypothetical protein